MTEETETPKEEEFVAEPTPEKVAEVADVADVAEVESTKAKSNVENL